MCCFGGGIVISIKLGIRAKWSQVGRTRNGGKSSNVGDRDCT
jgi:hypothetical protein